MKCRIADISDLKGIQAECYELRIKVAYLTAESTEQKQRLMAQAERSAAQAAMIDECQQENTRLTAERENLKLCLSDIHDLTLVDIEDYERVFDSIQHLAKTAVPFADVAAYAEIEQQNERLGEENTRLTAELAELRHELACANEELGARLAAVLELTAERLG